MITTIQGLSPVEAKHEMSRDSQGIGKQRLASVESPIVALTPLFATAVQGSFAFLISQIDEALVAVHELSHNKPHAVCQGTYGDSYRFFQL